MPHPVESKFKSVESSHSTRAPRAWAAACISWNADAVCLLRLAGEAEDGGAFAAGVGWLSVDVCPSRTGTSGSLLLHVCRALVLMDSWAAAAAASFVDVQGLSFVV